jgi:hypothetical protein
MLTICFADGIKEDTSCLYRGYNGATICQFALHLWVFAAEITDDLILELDDILCTHDTCGFEALPLHNSH